MKADDLKAIRERADKATSGPWEVMGKDGHIIGNDYQVNQCHCQWTHNTTPNNADFIAHARTDIPLLLAEIERQQAEIAELRKRCFCPHEEYSMCRFCEKKEAAE